MERIYSVCGLLYNYGRLVLESRDAKLHKIHTVLEETVSLKEACALVAVIVECRICILEVAVSNLSLGYCAPRSTQPFIPPWSVNEYQLR